MSDTPPFPLELSTTLSLRSGDQSWGSERRMALLAAIGTEGSISAAARKVGLSYKAAWDAVDMMNNLAGGLLVERVTGGKRGGGALLTERARQLVAWYQAARAEHQRFMQALSQLGPDGARHLDLLHSMALQTSARNRFEGVISGIEADGVNDHVRLRLDEHITLGATLTHASTERLALAPGRRALAFVKAQAVRILPGGPDAAADRGAPDGPAPATCWTGRISHVVADPTWREVSLDVTPSIRITGLMPAAAAAPRAGRAARRTAPKTGAGAPGTGPGALEIGAMAQACFRAGDVLIGTLD